VIGSTARGRILAGSILITAGLSACRRDAPVATLRETVGTVERSEGVAWRDVGPGFAFVVGDTLRTSAASSARLALTGGGMIRVGENGRLRFQRGTAPGQRAPDVVVDLGSAEIEETTGELSVITAVGPARIDRGAHVRVQANGQAASLEVLVGRAVMMNAGREVAIDTGQGVRIQLGSAQVQRFDVKVGQAVLEQEPGSPDAGTPVAEATPDAGGRAPEPAAPSPPSPTATSGEAAAGPHAGHPDTSRADVTITAGESATLHVGRPPLAVRVRFEEVCPGGAVVELGGHGHHGERLEGSGAVVLRLRPGTRPYRVRCAGDGRKAEPRATGVLSLRRDTGNVPLPRRAPANVIDADGRRYTVLFQTRLPQLTLAWPRAAGATGLELHLESPAGTRVLPVASLGRPLPSGTLQEGTYTWWYTAGDGRQSPKTTVSIRFDNTAPTAQFFRARPDAGDRPPGSIAVDGVTVEGAKVSVGGKPLSLDGRGRFRADVAPAAGDDAVAVRLELPRTGVHYYVRRRSDVR
jgi:hypothetical protein